MKAAVAAVACSYAAHVTAYAAVPALRPAVAPVHAPRASSIVRMEAVANEECASVVATESPCSPGSRRSAPFKKVMAANRAEIAVRIMRACTELNMETVAIFGYEDRFSQHRWGAEQSFMLEKDITASPISAYLDIDQIIKIATENGVSDATGQPRRTLRRFASAQVSDKFWRQGPVTAARVRVLHNA